MKKHIKASAIVFPTPVFIVGSYDKDGKPNVMNAAWGGICSSEPPCLMVAVRKNRHTNENIMIKKEFTISIPSEQYVKEADYFGIASGKKEDKFEVSGLTPVKASQVDAPYVGEFPLALECRMVSMTSVGSHDQIIGEIVNVIADEECLNSKGLPDIEKVRPMMYDTVTRCYNGMGPQVAEAFSAGTVFRPKK